MDRKKLELSENCIIGWSFFASFLVLLFCYTKVAPWLLNNKQEVLNGHGTDVEICFLMIIFPVMFFSVSFLVYFIVSEILKNYQKETPPISESVSEFRMKLGSIAYNNTDIPIMLKKMEELIADYKDKKKNKTKRYTFNK